MLSFVFSLFLIHIGTGIAKELKEGLWITRGTRYSATLYDGSTASGVLSVDTSIQDGDYSIQIIQTATGDLLFDTGKDSTGQDAFVITYDGDTSGSTLPLIKIDTFNLIFSPEKSLEKLKAFLYGNPSSGGAILVPVKIGDVSDR